MNASEDAWNLPEPLRELVARLPQRPHALAVAAVLNLGAGARLDADSLARLQGKVIRIVVRDAGICITLSHDGRVFRALSSSIAADVTITATAHDFFLLAARKEDPDTLFFARRLAMDGDTEIGLVAKNMLDALDVSDLLARFDRPASLLRRLRALLPRPPLLR